MDESVRVVFFTKTYDGVMPDVTYTVPTRVLPGGLSDLVNSVLALTPEVPMDFFIDSEVLTRSLDRYLREHSTTKSREDVLSIEYAPSLQYAVQQRMPHDDWVSSVRSLSPSSGMFLTGAYDHCLRVWYLQEPDPECVTVGQVHTGPIKEVCLLSVPVVTQHAKKKRLLRPSITNLECASASKDGTVALWAFDAEAEGLRTTHRVQFHTDSVETVDFDAASGLIASGGWDTTLCVWRPMEEEPRHRLKGHVRAVLRCRFSGGGLLSTGLDGALRVWDVATGSCSHTMHAAHAAYGMGVRNGTDCATGHTDAKVRLWDLRTNKVTHTLPGHKQWIYAVAYCDDFRCVSTSEDATVRLWDVRVPNGAMLVMDTQHTDGVLDVCHGGAATLATASKDNTVKLVEIC